MTSCALLQEDLTAWIDGELPREVMERTREHVASCATCSAEAESLRASIALQRTALAQLVAADDVNVSALQARVRRAVTAETERRESIWSRLVRPLVLAPAFAMLAVLMMYTTVGGPSDVLVPLGVTSPPPVVKQATGLFPDYTLIEHLEALEHFDTVEAAPLDDDDQAAG